MIREKKNLQKKKKMNNFKKNHLLHITSLNIEKKNLNNNKDNSIENIEKNNSNLNTNQPLTLPKLTNNITNNQRILKIKTPIKENNIIFIFIIKNNNFYKIINLYKTILYV